MSLTGKLRKAVSYMVVRHMFKKPFRLHLDEAIVSFTFDDVPSSALTTGLDILSKYRYPCTFYMAFDLMKKTGINLNEDRGLLLQKIRESNSEIACHTFSHIHFFKSGTAKIIADLEHNQEFVSKLLPGYKFTNFSFPFGEQTLAARRIISGRFRTARSVYKGLNYGKIDLNGLKAVRIYETIDIRETKAMIDLAIEKKAWLIFYTHDVSESPTENGCSPAYFEEIVSYCREKNLKALTIEQAIHKISQDN